MKLRTNSSENAVHDIATAFAHGTSPLAAIAPLALAPVGPHEGGLRLDDGTILWIAEVRNTEGTALRAGTRYTIRHVDTKSDRDLAGWIIDPSGRVASMAL